MCVGKFEDGERSRIFDPVIISIHKSSGKSRQKNSRGKQIKGYHLSKTYALLLLISSPGEYVEITVSLSVCNAMWRSNVSQQNKIYIMYVAMHVPPQDNGPRRGDEGSCWMHHHHHHHAAAAAAKREKPSRFFFFSGFFWRQQKRMMTQQQQSKGRWCMRWQKKK